MTLMKPYEVKKLAEYLFHNKYGGTQLPKCAKLFTISTYINQVVINFTILRISAFSLQIY